MWSPSPSSELRMVKKIMPNSPDVAVELVRQVEQVVALGDADARHSSALSLKCGSAKVGEEKLSHLYCQLEILEQYHWRRRRSCLMRCTKPTRKPRKRSMH
jgi:hypothetical protein